VAHASPEVSALADCLLPLPQVADRRTTPQSARSAARGTRARPEPQCWDDPRLGSKTTRVGGPERGYDGAKRIAGRKRRLHLDTNGLVLAARGHSADLPDRDSGRRLLDEGHELPRLDLLWADGVYTGGFCEWPRRQLGWRLEVPHHRDQELRENRRMEFCHLTHLLLTPGLAQDTDPILVSELSERLVVVASVPERRHQLRQA
jgi:hypothetical protein